MIDSNGVDWSWALQFLALIVLIVIVAGFAVIVISSALATTYARWKKVKNE